MMPIDERAIPMPHIPYQPIDVTEPKALIDAIRTRRGGRLLNLDRILLYSPPFAQGWNVFLKEVRTGLELSPKLRELAICLVAILNGADYEFHHHAPEFLKAGGTGRQVDALHLPHVAANDSLLFSREERAAIHLTIEMTRDIKVSDTTFHQVREALNNNRHVMELVGVIATYNMVSRILVAVGIEPE
jgi:alkylhydroperoxidase family enzyme